MDEQIKSRQQQKSNDSKVFDVLEEKEVPVSDFLNQPNTILLIRDNKRYGIYLASNSIFYECEETMNTNNLKGIVRFDTQEPFYFRETDPIINDMKDGYNIFHIQTSDEPIQIIGKDYLKPRLTRQNIDYSFNCKGSYNVNVSETLDKYKEGKLELTSPINFDFKLH